MPKAVPKWARARRSARSASPEFRNRTSVAMPTTAGPAINEQTALTITAVYNAVSLISNGYACLDAGVAEKTGRGGRRDAVELPLFDVLARRPNRRNTAFRWRRSSMVHALTQGNSYSEILFQGKVPVGLHLLEPRNVEPRTDDETGELVYDLIAEKKTLPQSKILHISNLGWDGVRGYSPVTLARETLGLAKAQEEHQAGLIGNNATPNGYLEVPQVLKEVQKNRIRADHEAMHRGTGNAGTVGILDGGMKWVATSFSSADAELLLSRGFSIAEVARLFCIPQHMIGLLEHATFSNIEQQLMEFYTFTLLPWITNIEQEMDVKFFTRSERKSFFVFHDLSTLMRADLAGMIARDQADFRMGLKSQNALLLRRGDNPVDHPNADKHWVEANNMVALEDMTVAGDAAVEDLDAKLTATLVAIAQQVTAGTITRDQAAAILSAAFPRMSPAVIAAIVAVNSPAPVAAPDTPDFDKTRALARVDYALESLIGEQP